MSEGSTPTGLDPKYVAGRVRMARAQNSKRDTDYRNVIAIRKGDYDTVAPGLFSSEFPKPLVANLIETTARDIAEVMAPMPTVSCPAATLSNDADVSRQDLRSAIANAYVQHSRLQDQRFGGADRFNSFGFMAYCVEPDHGEQMPSIRVSSNPHAYYTQDYRGRTHEFFEPYYMHPDALVREFGHVEGLIDALRGRYGTHGDQQRCEVVRWRDKHCDAIVLLDPCVVLYRLENKLGKCPVRVVERPQLAPSEGPRGQFDDVIWVQVARGLVSQYTMNALERSVNAPVVVPDDVQELELGAFAAIQTKNPQGVGTVPLQLSPGLFPQQQMLQAEQLQGSRYPEGRSGSIDASIITGQGVQALMGTFDTQVQTFQRLDATALEDVISMCFEMDEKLWPDAKKTRYIKDNGAPRKVEYTPEKDIGGNYLADVSYGAIAGLDPNRGLVFLLQGLAGGLFSKQTARRYLPVDLNPAAEERQIQAEQMDDSLAAALSTLPQAVPQMAMNGMDPRDILLQVVAARGALQRGKSPVEAIQEAFKPKEPEQPAPVDPLAAAAEQAAAGGGMPGMPGMPGGSGSPANDLLMLLAGQTQSGAPNLQATISRMKPI